MLVVSYCIAQEAVVVTLDSAFTLAAGGNKSVCRGEYVSGEIPAGYPILGPCLGTPRLYLGGGPERSLQEEL